MNDVSGGIMLRKVLYGMRKGKVEIEIQNRINVHFITNK